MPRSLRHYSIAELQNLLSEIQAAIREAEELERRPKSPEAVGAAPPPETPADRKAEEPERATDIAAAHVSAASPTEAAQERSAPEAAPPPSVAPPDSPASPVIKYMHPANRKMVWSGEGEQPDWVTAYLAGGGSWTALANAAEKLAPWQR